MSLYTGMCKASAMVALLLGVYNAQETMALKIPGTNIEIPDQVANIIDDVTVPPGIQDIIQDVTLPPGVADAFDEVIPGASDAAQDILDGVLGSGESTDGQTTFIPLQFLQDLTTFIDGLDESLADFSIPMTVDELNNFEFPDILGLGDDFTLPTTVEGWQNFELPDGAFAMFDLAGVVIPQFLWDQVNATVSSQNLTLPVGFEAFVPADYITELTTFIESLADVWADFVIPTDPTELINFQFPAEFGLGDNFTLPVTLEGWENFVWPATAFGNFDFAGSIPQFILDQVSGVQSSNDIIAIVQNLSLPPEAEALLEQVLLGNTTEFVPGLYISQLTLFIESLGDQWADFVIPTTAADLLGFEFPDEFGLGPDFRLPTTIDGWFNFSLPDTAFSDFNLAGLGSPEFVLGQVVDFELPSNFMDLFANTTLPSEVEVLLTELTTIVNGVLGETFVPVGFIQDLNDFIVALGGDFSDFQIPTTAAELANFEFPSELGFGDGFTLPTTIEGWQNFQLPEGSFGSFNIDGPIPLFAFDQLNSILGGQLTNVSLPPLLESLLQNVVGVNGLLEGITPIDLNSFAPADYIEQLNLFIATFGGEWSDFVIPTDPLELVNFVFPDALGLGDDFRLPTTVMDWQNFTLPEGAFVEFDTSEVVPSLSSDQVAVCNFCDSGSITNPDNMFGGLKCSDWQTVGTYSVGPQCTMLRAGAVDFCGCETQVTESCNLCPDGSQDVEQALAVTLADFQCGDIVTMTAVDGDETCEVLSQYSHVCQCPDSPSSCSLCEEPDTLSNPSNLLITTDGSSGELLSDTTCADYNQVLSTVVPRNAEGSCRERVLETQTEIGFNIMGFCGCSNAPIFAPDEGFVCSVCPDGMVPKENDLDFVHDSIMTSCQAWIDLAPFITIEAQCQSSQERVKVDCCVASGIGSPEETNGPDSIIAPEDSITSDAYRAPQGILLVGSLLVTILALFSK